MVGYSLAQSGDRAFLGNLDMAFLRGLAITGEDGGSGLLTVAFLGMFAVITPALISGAVADRIKFSAWAIFALAWLLLVFVPVFKWVYGGWIGDRVRSTSPAARQSMQTPVSRRSPRCWCWASARLARPGSIRRIRCLW